MIDKTSLATQAVKGATASGIGAAAGAIVTGYAMATIPVKILWVTVAATTVVSWPVALAVGAGGAVLGGATAAYINYRKQKAVEDEFDQLVNSNPHKVSEN